MNFHRLYERVVAPLHLKQERLFHGTNGVEKIRSILSSMTIEAPSIEYLDKRYGMKVSRPVEGRIYITTNPSYAYTYAAKGIVTKNHPADRYNKEHWYDRYGMIFEVDGTAMEDVQPDEDILGEFLHDIVNRKKIHTTSIKHPDNFPNDSLSTYLLDLIGEHLNEDEFMALKRYDDFDDLINAGKTIVSVMDDWSKLEFIKICTQYAATGTLKVKKGYLIDLTKHPSLLNSDQSNVLQIATPIDNKQQFEKMINKG